ncbi:hypothetical protein ACFQX7_31155 [Luedemannella flava]
MTEPTTAPDDNPAPVPATERASRPTARWHQRRFPLVAMVGVLLVGCFLGAGVTAFGALVVSLVHHGHDDRMERRGDPARTAWSRGAAAAKARAASATGAAPAAATARCRPRRRRRARRRPVPDRLTRRYGGPHGYQPCCRGQADDWTVTQVIAR